jgi:hypothetical protein
LDSNGDVDYYCFVVALGLKGNIHDVVEFKFNEELKILSQPHEYYHREYKSNLLAAVFLVALVRDKPAKADANMTGHHNQLFSRRSRWAGFLNITIKIESCFKCAQRRQNKLQGIVNKEDYVCEECADFDYLTLNGILHVPINHPNEFKYPKSTTEGSPVALVGREVGSSFLVMPPVEHTYPWLLTLVWFAFYNFHFRTHKQHLRRQQGQSRIRGGVMSAQGWKSAELESYLKSGGIGGVLIRLVKSFSAEHREKHPSQLEDSLLKILPPLWFRDGCEIWHHHDAVFHLLYHGLVLCSIDMVVGSLKEYTGIRGDFHQLCNPILCHIHSLQLHSGR